ncbi:hypothetical protein [Micromonospora aurantiaca (nom. illeg.)]|uniref:hypothetical protein n=1 Tax=Micromonospora aurantiaca (nom. illeg.) TaxID=47850 RepID=UPI001656B3E4|nr:hypothetical protein [Micromonospora aurantiaca]MBC9000465.1 hypothetical protein [Micromonospora aurantiaca]
MSSRSRVRRRCDVELTPEHQALVEAVETLLGEWSGPGTVRPHGVAHQDPRTELLTWHLHGLPEQLDYILAALRGHETPEVRLARTLTEIADVDPSRTGHSGPDTPEITARYARRNALVWAALSLAHEVGLPAGVGHDPADEVHPVVVYIELPGGGQVSWHLPAHPAAWDGHTTAEKYERVIAFAELIGERPAVGR